MGLLGLDVVLRLEDHPIAAPCARANAQEWVCCNNKPPSPSLTKSRRRHISRWERRVLGAALMALARPRLSSLEADMSKMKASGMSCGSSKSSGIV